MSPQPVVNGEMRNDPPAAYEPVRRAVANDAKESLISANLVIEGKIDGAGDVRIAGRFKGDVHVQGNLTIEDGAKLTGSIRANTVVIGGELEGNIDDAARVEVQSTGVISCEASVHGGQGGNASGDYGTGGGGGAGRVGVQGATGSACGVDVSGGASGEGASTDAGALAGAPGVEELVPPVALGLDQDGDLVPDALELAGNTDGDALSNTLDADDDGDSLKRDTLPAFDAKQPPPSVIVAPFESGTRFGTGEIVTQVSSRDVGPLPFEGKR
jgi:hypothetical protein